MLGLVPDIRVLQTIHVAGSDIRDAVQRDHNIKHWSRAWKVRKIVVANPDWDDLCPTITS
jgi:predicted GIY-YIG superfamily endonuclease